MGVPTNGRDGGALPPGTRLNEIWEIEDKIAAGGMGEVYRGHNIHTGDRVAIKVVRLDFADHDLALAMFRKEAAALNELFDEAIVRYYLFSLDPVLRRPYLVMEYVDGPSLKDVLADGPLEFAAACTLARRICAGLAIAHDHGIFHRDLSPDNIILKGGDPARAKIIDFGIARQVGGALGTVVGEGFAGKYGYVSPEQVGLCGGVVGAASDIYGFGLVLAEAISGRPRDMKGNAVEVIEKRRRLPDLSDVDERLRPLVARMLAPDPGDRPSSMREVVHLLGELLDATRHPGTTSADAGAATVVLHRPSGGASSGAAQTLAAPTAPTFVPPVPPSSSRPPVDAADRGEASGTAERIAPAAPPPPPPPAPTRPSDSVSASAASSPSPSSAPERSGRRLGLVAGVAAVALIAAGGGLYMAMRAPTSETPHAPPSVVATPSQPSPPPSSPSPAFAEPSVRPSTPSAAPAAEGGIAAGAGPGPSTQVRVPEAQPVRPPPAAVAAAPSETPTSPGAPTATDQRRGEVSGDDLIADLRIENPQPRDVERYLLDYVRGGCIHLEPTSTAIGAVRTAAYGSSVRPFEVLDADFRRAFGFPIDIDLHLVMPAQCAAVDRLERARRDATRPPELTVSAEGGADGATLDGRVGTDPGRSVAVVLVEDDGMVRSVAAPAIAAAGAPARTFSVRVARRTSGGPKPQLLLAVATARPLDVLGAERPQPLAQFLEGLDRQAAGTPIALSVRYLVIHP